MAHSYLAVYLHIVFSTKGRLPLITPEVQKPLWRYLAGIARNHGMKALAIGGMRDHVHLLVSFGAETSVARAVNLLKANSSRWLRGQLPKFGWQEGYAAFSVTTSGLESVSRYIEEQPRHHSRRDFQQEYLALLRKHKIVYDPKWVLG